MGDKVNYRSVIREFSWDNHGLVTTKDAKQIGVPAVELRKLAQRKFLSSVGHGVYRVLEVPARPNDEYAEAILLVGDDAVLADETVLAIYDLTPVSMRKIKIATPHRVRRKIPETIAVTKREVPLSEIEHIDGIPAMNVFSAIRASRKRLLPHRCVAAIEKAATLDLITRSEKRKLLKENSLDQ